jgi:CRISPR-associated protein Csy1
MSLWRPSFGACGATRIADILAANPRTTIHTRDRVGDLMDSVVDELLIYAAEQLHCPAGWSRDASFDDLADEEKLWLDPLGAELPEEVGFASRWLSMDWTGRIGERFGKWLNAQLQDMLPEAVYAEPREWRGILLGEG